MNILFVEDDAMIASGKINALQSCDPLPRCRDCASLIERAILFSCLALLDLSLPDGDGFGIFEHIRRTSPSATG